MTTVGWLQSGTSRPHGLPWGSSCASSGAAKTYNADAIDALAEILCALNSVENARHRRFVQRDIFANLVSPNTASFEHSLQRFDRVGVTPPSDAALVLKTAILIQQAVMEAKITSIQSSLEEQEQRIQVLRS